ncbi:dipeptide/oligopeptide ABC transporter substrate-binding protein (plasmid) [Rhizobium gallicum]|uniref:Dipeptide/oligopeptide ABC transporter substrate-binding protein n=2 Tax=Rhizobium gallicum TaxID=56730 RepID=A0A1L5NR50_9HYPH|nr:dipeptide/oligopeptide ABC transporter substrate-binding protein [Rhizobium gallicum]
MLRAQAAAEGGSVKWARGLPTIFDPYTTTDVNTIDYAFGIYDMLFGIDSNLVPQPQMVASWSAADDKMTYTFILRDGLTWHDGAPVTAADCIASIRRWFQTPGGQLVKERAKDVSKLDEKSFVIVLKKPLGILIDQLAQVGSYALFIMREKDAHRPPSDAVTTHVGSGPFKFNEELYVPGSSITFDKYDGYVPRDEAPDGLAGGKIAKANRVVWENLPDPQTSLAALQAGEVDLLAEPPADLFPMIESDPGLVLENLYKSGYDYFLRMNCLQKPFDNVKARQAMLHLIDQETFLHVINPSLKGNRNVTSLFGTNTAYSNDTNTSWFRKGGNPEKAKQLFKEAGYAGEKVVILDPTDWTEAHNASLFLAAELRKIGVNVDLASSDWAGLVARRAKKDSVENGGWSIFITSVPDFSLSTPFSSAYTTMNGEQGWFGWPQSNEYEALRSKWPDAAKVEEHQALAREMQQIWWDYATWVYLGQVPTLTAYRKELTGLIGVQAGRLPMWNMRKV